MIAAHLLAPLLLLLALPGPGFTAATSGPSASAPSLPPFEVYQEPDLTAFYPGETAVDSTALWVRGAGTLEITDFVHDMTVFAKLMSNISTITFAELGSARGMCRLSNFTRDCLNPWAGTGSDVAHPVSVGFAIVSRQSSDAMFYTEPDISMYPLLGAAVAIVHGIEGLTAPLVLSRSVIARMYRKCDNSTSTCPSDYITHWNDPEILALNPHQQAALTKAGAIRLLVRSDNSGTTRAFRLALEAWDPEFTALMAGVDINGGSWPGVDVIKIQGAQAMAGAFLNGAYVPPGMANIGYSPMRYVNGLNLQTVGITESTREAAVFPVPDSITRGFYERSMSWPIVPNNAGNFFEVVTLSNAANVDAWPIMFTQYLVIRLNHLRAGATCENRVENLRFYERLMDPTSTLLQTLANSSDVIMFPPEARTRFIEHIHANFMCLGQRVVDLADSTKKYDIVLAVPTGLESFVGLINARFIKEFHPELINRDQSSGNNNGQPLFSYKVVTLDPDVVSVTEMLATNNASAGMVLAPTWMTEKLKDSVVVFPWLAVAMVVRVNWCGSDPNITATCVYPTDTAGSLNFTASLLANIFEQKILYWNDSAIAELNPNVELPYALIVPVPPEQGPWRDAAADMFLRAIGALRFEFSAAYYDPSTAIEVQAALYSTQYAIAVVAGNTPVAFEDDTQTIVGAIDSGNQTTFDPILPSISSIITCATTPGAFDDANRVFDIAGNSIVYDKCYSLVVTLNWAIKRVQGLACNDGIAASNVGRPGFISSVSTPADSAALRLIEYLQWLIQFRQYENILDITAGARYQFFNPTPVTAPDPLTVTFHVTNYVALFNIAKLAFGAASNFTLRTVRAIGLNSIKCNENDEISLVSTQETLNLIPDSLIYGFGYTILVLTLLLCVSLAVWVQQHKHRKVVRMSSPNFMWTVIFGGVVCLLTIVPLGMQDAYFDRNIGYTNQDLAYLDAACQSIPWLYTMGFTIQFSALFVKTWRLVLIFDNPHMKKLNHLHDSDLLKRMTPLFLIVIVINGVWLAIDPLTWDRLPLVISLDGQTVYSSVGICTVKGNPWVWVGLLLGVLLFVLLAGLRLCYKARALPSDFNESAWISLALLVQFQSLVMAVPVLAQITSNPTASYIFKVVIVTLSSTGTILLIFAPKVWRINGWGDSGSGSQGAKSSRAGQGNVGQQAAAPSSKQDKVTDETRSKVGFFRRMPGKPSDHSNDEFKTEKHDTFLVDSLVSAAAEYRATAGSQQVKPSSASLDAVTGGALHSKGIQFYEAMKDKALRAILFSRLRKSYRAEGLEFFVCVLERNRVEDMKERAAATRTIVREFVLNDAKRQVNIASMERDRLIRACLEEDETKICGDDFFSAPALDSCKELIASKEFADFTKEFLASDKPRKTGSKVDLEGGAQTDPKSKEWGTAQGIHSSPTDATSRPLSTKGGPLKRVDSTMSTSSEEPGSPTVMSRLINRTRMSSKHGTSPESPKSPGLAAKMPPKVPSKLEMVSVPAESDQGPAPPGSSGSNNPILQSETTALQRAWSGGE